MSRSRKDATNFDSLLSGDMRETFSKLSPESVWGFAKILQTSRTSSVGRAHTAKLFRHFREQITGRDAKFFSPPQLWTPSTNSFAYSQSELHDMNMNDLRLRNKSTHARGLVILLSRWGYTQDAYLNFLYQFTCKNNGDLRLSYIVLCSHSELAIQYTALARSDSAVYS